MSTAPAVAPLDIRGSDMKNHDIITISGEVHHETDNAYLFTDGSTEVDDKTLKKFWLPKSQCEWDALDREMQIPEWLAEDKGLI